MAVLNVDLRAWLRLARAGLVKPVTDKRGTKRQHFYDLREIAKLIDRLARAAPVVKTVREGLVPIVKSYIGTDKVCQLVLDGKVRVVERLAGAKGLRSLFIDPADLHRLAIQAEEISLFLVSRTIMASAETALECFNAGLLIGRTENRKILISVSSLQDFRRQYITLRELGRRTGLDFSFDSRWIAMTGVKPAERKGKRLLYVYPRDPIEKALPKIIATAHAEAGIPSRVKWVGQEVLNILLKTEKPISAMDLFKLIGNKRMKLPEPNPIYTFRKILWLNRNKIECFPSIGYWPRGRALDRREITNRKYRKWIRIGELVREYLTHAAHPVCNKHLRNILMKHRIKFPPTYAEMNMGRTLRRHREHIVYLKGRGYWLRDRPYKPANYRPDGKAAAA